MSSKKQISSDQLAKQVLEFLNAYTDDIVDGVETCTKEVAKNGVESLKRVKRPEPTSYGGSNSIKRRDWDRYSKGWSQRDTAKKAQGFVRSTIHNKDHYQLTHLLEYGHATRNGNRTRAFAHIKPIEEELVKEYEEKVKELIKRGDNNVRG